MRRAELALVLALGCLCLGGCMKIYPDPELPDVAVSWLEGDCADGTGNVTISLVGVDDTSEQHTQSVACTDYKLTFKDVSRQRFHILGELYDTAGALYSATESDVDLRNGYDEDAFIYFGGFSNYRIAWIFDMGATCESLGADGVEVLFYEAGQVAFSMGGPCDLGVLTGSGAPGIYSARVGAFMFEGAILATSMEVPATIPSTGRTDLGTVALTPCAPSCPQP